MGVIVTRSTVSQSGSASGTGAYTSAEKLAMEMEMEFKAANASYFKELGYDVDDNLTTVDIWTTPSKVLQLFSKTLTYDGGKLDRTLLTRITDDAKILKIFSYDVDDNLSSVEVSAG
jgi:hypothetical protein